MIQTRPKTKIVCTLGPATVSPKIIQGLIEKGMSIARLNMSHGSLEEHVGAVQTVRQASERLGIPVGIMVDVPGAKYRTGPLIDGVLNLENGDSITLTSRDVVGTKNVVAVNPPGIHRDAPVGSPVLLDDGLMELTVEKVTDDEVHCKVVRGGRLTEKRGVAAPGRTPSQPFPSDFGLAALRFAADHQADFVALSMVSSGKNVMAARGALQKHGHDPFIISKIELAGAINQFDEILDVSDGIMVARGDMGVEVRLAEVPVIQKRLISQCNEKGKPVITATQMLESMVRSPVPTRAEVTDVANAIFDGTDAIMLSGETSVGEHPIAAVQVMAEVAMVAEAGLPYERILSEQQEHQENEVDDAIAYDACHTAQQLDSKLVIAFTESGGTAGRVSKYRPKAHIIALTPNEDVLRKLVLRWGVTPFIVPPITQVDGFFDLAAEYAKGQGGVSSGESIVLVAGLPIGVSGGTNLLRVLSIR